MRRIVSAMNAELWAITPEALHQVVAIAQGYGDPEAVIAKLGKPLTNTRTVTVRDGVAVVPVVGPIFRYANLFTDISGATSIQTLAADFQAAVDNPAVKAIILEIDSPGGQVSGVSEFAAQVRAANVVKPVAAYISDTGASAAYWIASAASSIITSDTSRLGSIGVVMQVQIAENDGTVKFISSQSPLKQARADSDIGRQQYQKTVDALAEVFIGAVANYRNVSIETVRSKFGSGGLFIASEAIAANMADKLGSLEQLISQLSSGKPLLNANQGNSTEAISQPVSNTKQENSTAVISQPVIKPDKAIKPEKAIVLTGADKWQHEWKSSTALQAEFKTMAAYVAYQKAASKGLVKRI